jgi:hypothetical protein
VIVNDGTQDRPAFHRSDPPEPEAVCRQGDGASREFGSLIIQLIISSKQLCRAGTSLATRQHLLRTCDHYS